MSFPWESNLRRTVKDTHGQGWSLRGKGEGTTQITRRWSDGTRSSITVPIPWARVSGPALLALIERLAQMTAPTTAGGQGLPLAKAAQLIQGEGPTSAAGIREGHVDWPAVAELYRQHRVETTGEVSARTWQRRYRLHVNQALALLAQPKRAPRDAGALLTAMVHAHPTAPGGRGRQERLGVVAGLMAFAVGHCGAHERWCPPADLGPWIGKRQDRKPDGVPLLDDQALRIYRAIADPRWRLAWGLMICFGLRPVELDHCRVDGDCLVVAGVKRNSAGAAGDRRVWSLDPEGFPGMGAMLLATLAERGPAGLPPPLRAAYRSTSIQKHLRRWVPEWEELVADAAAAGQGHLTVYSCRHGYAFRGTQLGLDHRTLSKLMGHTPAVHLKHYGRWTDEESVAAAVAAAVVHHDGPPLSRPGTYPR